MSTPTVSLLRQRMIESLPPRRRREGGGHERSQALCGTQRGHIRSCKRFAAFLKRSPETATLEDIRLFQLHLAETGMSICNRNRIMHGRAAVFVPRHAAATGPCSRDLSHP